MNEKIKIKKVIVDKMPKSCAECPLTKYSDHNCKYLCKALPYPDNLLTDDVYSMTFRRHDCPMEEE